MTAPGERPPWSWAGRWWVAGVATGLVVVAGLGWLVADLVTGLPDGVALRVGDTVVTEAQVQRSLSAAEVLDGAARPDRDAARREAARAVAVGIVVDRDAARRGLTVTRVEADAALARVVRARSGGRAGFARDLDALGVTEADVAGEVRRRLTEARLLAQVVAGVPAVTEADVQQAYDARRPVTPQRRRLHNIVVDSEPRAAEVLEKARAGADFAALAVEYSLDEATRATGGDLGDRTADELEKPYADVAFGAGVGEYFGPVRTGQGWNVGQVVSVQSGLPRGIEQVAAELRAALRAERERGAWHAFLVEQVRAADVEYAPPYRPAAPADPP
ncbi:MAG: peptidylprolyl isomerase [Pseudonocardia sp.]